MLNQSNNSIKLEIIGLFLILLSFFIQMEEIKIANEIQRHENYQLHNKIDYLWTVVSHDFIKKYPEENSYSSFNFKHLFEDYKIYSQNLEEINKLKKGYFYDWFINLRVYFFIIGSIILIISKILLIRK